MKIKKHRQVDYIAVKEKERRNLCIVLIICLTLISCIGISVIVKLFIECYSLTMENQSLRNIIKAKDSMIADLEENCNSLYNNLKILEEKE